MSMSEDDAEPGAQGDENSDEESDASDSGSSNASSDVEDDDEDDDVSESGVNAWVSQFSGVKDADEEDDTATTAKPKINLKDLGLLTVKDPQLKKSVKLMGKEEKESTKKHKLDVPLARRQQARLDRSAAYEKTNETLDRWTETVKQNRRAEHLVFPLPQTETGISRHDNTELQLITNQAPSNELEQTILAIMEESGLGPSTKKESKKVKDQADETAAGEQSISRSELQNLWNKRRQEREAKSREEARAKRIKKIKSKAYHRVHRKQRERDEMKEREIMAATGELDSEDEREALDRQRAMERMGSRHRESKWAKMRKGHAVWDDDVREGITDMARRDEELRRRIEGRAKAGDDDDADEDESDYSNDDEVDERKRLLRQLDEASKEDDDSQSKSKLMSMAFMQKAEAAKKKANDEMIAEIRRELGSDDEGDSEAEPDDVGRRQFGQPDSKKSPFSKDQPKKGKGAKADRTELQDTQDTTAAVSTNGQSKGLSAPAPRPPESSSIAGAWSQPAEASGPAKKQRGKKSGSGVDVLDFSIDSVAVAPAAAAAARPKAAKSKRQQQDGAANNENYGSDGDEDESHLVQFREQELLDRAFGGLDVVADFEREKREIAEDDDDKVVDETLPGWGSWVGDGVSNREKRRHQGRFLAKKEGVKREKDRRDAKLKNVIINEKRIRKVSLCSFFLFFLSILKTPIPKSYHHIPAETKERKKYIYGIESTNDYTQSEKYMASQLPHVYESKTQYERSLRLPLGPEFQTKETFQEVTKPRVLLKQGIIAPMAKPTH